ncbi:MFS transporter [Pseudomonas syringae pv. tagetis]|uniref:MFS transporter n=2 Tax=Pseudomonas syringae group genomosp. 7 TaxID=251699 RepID=A0A0Q0BJ66_9PSED|nr:MFS transporter [Pseudomonas syringae group genomosp. 7]KPX46499.1 Transport protein [Pseudomonas syringae pv. helianthi]KPY90071.1 Transport protein [Pseudomonas syringae pv. tagetis]RMR07879.1 Transport protein [Pseudomonas syringae pv. helianthi]RMV45969.1 Transport protein [Pseudomonas syringae pv. helianthi]RMW15366.1 Transport protein [Pseudomonas syringae pv. tagetis]
MSTNNPAFEKAVVRKVTLRIIPFVFLLYIVSYLDRANIGYAALQMNADLALTSEAFGFISGIFFIGYFLFEVPSNVLLNRYGARVWIARILVTWGLIAAATAFAQTSTHLYVLRFLLGVAEAGFFPGIIVYLTYWFRSKELATTVALFTAAIPVSYIIGAPLSTWIMDNIHWFGWSGWRWMLFLEGIPALFLGVACFFYLTDKPEQAKWIKQDEREWLLAELERDRQSRKNVKHFGALKAMTNPKVLYLSFIYFVYQCGSLGVGYWMPQIIKGFSDSLTHTQIGMIAMVPYIFATLMMIGWSRNSDRHGERKLHCAIPLAVATAAMVGASMVSDPIVAIAMISLALAGLYSFKSPFWALPTLFLSRSTAAVSIAVINSIGNIGGFVGPFAIGMIKGSTNSASMGLLFLSGLLAIAFVMTLLMRIHNGDTPSNTHPTIAEKHP